MSWMRLLWSIFMLLMPLCQYSIYISVVFWSKITSCMTCGVLLCFFMQPCWIFHFSSKLECLECVNFSLYIQFLDVVCHFFICTYALSSSDLNTWWQIVCMLMLLSFRSNCNWIFQVFQPAGIFYMWLVILIFMLLLACQIIAPL